MKTREWFIERIVADVERRTANYDADRLALAKAYKELMTDAPKGISSSASVSEPISSNGEE